MTDRIEVYGRARSLLAALADTAEGADDAAGYDQVLLMLDVLTPAPRQPITRRSLPDGGRADVYRQARDALAELGADGVDLLEVGICRSMLAAVWDRERSR